MQTTPGTTGPCDDSITRMFAVPKAAQPGAPPDDAAMLIAIDGPSRGTAATLCRDRTTIGRRPDNDLVLVSPAVSKYHACTHRSGNRHSIEDLNSTNGVLVNGILLAAGEPRPLFHGDNILICDHLLLFHDRAASTHQRGMDPIELDRRRVKEEVELLLASMPGLSRPRPT